MGGTSSTTAALVVVRGCAEDGDPFDTSARKVNNTTPVGAPGPEIVTTVADTLIVGAAATIDNRTYSNWSTTDPGALAEQFEILNTVGDDTGVALATAPKTSVGATGLLTWNSTFSSNVAFLGALRPAGSSSTTVTRAVATTWDVAATVTKSVATTWDVDEPGPPPAGGIAVVRVRQSAAWRTVSGGQPTVTAPDAPRDLAVVASSGQLAAAWQPPYDDRGAPVTGYTVTVTPDDAPPLQLGAGARSATLTGLNNGVVYTLTVAARNTAGPSQPAEQIAAPAGPWVIGSVGPLVGAPDWWGGNNGVNNGRGAYGMTEPPTGVTSGADLGPDYCGVLPVLTAQGRGYDHLTKPAVGTLIDAKGLPSGAVTVDATTGSTSVTVTRPGAVLQYLDIVGQVFVRAPNVTIRYCRINGRLVTGSGKYLVSTQDANPGLVISYCELICGQAMSAALPPYGGYTARYCDLWGISNDAFKVGSNALVEYNWVHGLEKAPGAHADPVQWTAGNNIAVVFNRLDCFTGPENAPSPEVQDFANGTLQVGKMTGNGSWFLMTDNYCNGANYVIRVGNVSPQTTAKGVFTTEHAYWYRNRFGRQFIAGPVYNSIQADADQVFDDTNVWHESGQTYRRTSQGWFYSHVVTAGEPVNDWTPVSMGAYP
ncbi:fibronectin type III domain-containing protein [Polymorphospora sp. 2-325]|uniref:Fibronectin type III domain-containing protein n=1 Tax=Polymorphospora lycopeni TaxID=3140240 RepID=A0ABV5CP91_9ACTN